MVVEEECDRLLFDLKDVLHLGSQSKSARMVKKVLDQFVGRVRKKVVNPLVASSNPDDPLRAYCLEQEEILKSKRGRMIGGCLARHKEEIAKCGGSLK